MPRIARRASTPIMPQPGSPGRGFSFDGRAAHRLRGQRIARRTPPSNARPCSCGTPRLLSRAGRASRHATSRTTHHAPRTIRPAPTHRPPRRARPGGRAAHRLQCRFPVFAALSPCPRLLPPLPPPRSTRPTRAAPNCPRC
ncbi:hypothetical protein C6V04_23660 [Burkholderia multivorans]|nr:hypothetical protein C6V04_23660 [Burkholderia multivorans]